MNAQNKKKTQKAVLNTEDILELLASASASSSPSGPSTTVVVAWAVCNDALGFSVDRFVCSEDKTEANSEADSEASTTVVAWAVCTNKLGFSVNKFVFPEDRNEADSGVLGVSTTVVAWAVCTNKLGFSEDGFAFSEHETEADSEVSATVVASAVCTVLRFFFSGVYWLFPVLRFGMLERFFFCAWICLCVPVRVHGSLRLFIFSNCTLAGKKTRAGTRTRSY